MECLDICLTYVPIQWKILISLNCTIPFGIYHHYAIVFKYVIVVRQINIRHNFFTSFNVGIVDGMSIIDLGCGWGSVSIYLASKFPKCKITSVSNSHSQKVFILARAAERGYKNISVYTGKQIFNLFDNFILKYFLSSFICHEICLVTNDVYRYQHP